MSGKNEYSNATKISHQLRKNIVSDRGPDTIQQVAAVPARGYITYSSPEIRDHRGDGHWQTQRRYDSPPKEISMRDHRGSNYYANSGYTYPKPNQMRSDNFHTFRNQGPPNSSNDPIFNEFLHSLMESFEGYDNPNIIPYRTEFASPVGYSVPNFTNSSSYHSVYTTTAHDPYSRSDSPRSTRAGTHRPEYGPWPPGSRTGATTNHRYDYGPWPPGPRPSATSYRPENGPWPPGPRAGEDSYRQMDEKPHYGPHFPTKQTQYRYPSPPNVHSKTEWFPEPGKQRYEISPRRNSRYRDHEYAPPAPTNQAQLPSTQPQNNSIRHGGDGNSPTGEVDSTWHSPKVHMHPSALAQNVTRPEMENGWEVRDNSQPNLVDTISTIGMGAVNFAKKNLYPGPALPENGNNGNQSQYVVPITQENGNTRPGMANRWFTRQPSSKEKNSHNEGLENGNTLPEFSTPTSQEYGDARPEWENPSESIKQPNKGETNSDSMKSKFFKYSHEKLNALPGNPNQWDISKQTKTGPDGNELPNTEHEYSNGGVLDSPRRSHVALDSQERGYGGHEGSNGSDMVKQANIVEKFSKLGALSSSKKNKFPSMFSKEK